MVRIIPLQSGSAGNSCLVESDGIRLLFDAGISASRVARRLADHGIDARSLDAVIISHEHSDHVGAAGALARRFSVPVHITEPTWKRAARAFAAGDPVRFFRAGETLRFASTYGTMSVETLPTPHDAVDGVVFVVDDGHARLGIMTDFGHVFSGLEAALRTCDGALIESNYDDDLLERGPYPAFLKRRISGPGGHISNRESAALIAAHGARLRWACLAHLSATNNRPDLACAAYRDALGSSLPLRVADRGLCSAPLEL